MYYVKNRGKKIYIEDDNVFTRCPRCGKELQVDLADAVIDGALDFYGTSWYCEKCSYKNALNHRGEEWAEMMIADYHATKEQD